jgi:hypothetical protein
MDKLGFVHSKNLIETFVSHFQVKYNLGDVRVKEKMILGLNLKRVLSHLFCYFRC